MRAPFAIILILLLSSGAMAQRQPRADSAYLFAQSLRVVDNAQQNAVFLINSDYAEISTVSLNYNTENGHFRTSQTAENGYDVAFKSSGISTLSRFKVSGYFNFTRTWQDSLSWNLQSLPDEVTPYYYIAGKAGKYQRLNYNFGGLLTYDLVKNKLYVAAGVDYLYNTASRSVDPRMSGQTFRLNLQPQLVYKFGKQLLGIGLSLGYGKENNSISYRNHDYSVQSQNYADRITYLVMGYGQTKIIGISELKQKSNSNGWALNYALKSDKGYINAGVNYVHDFQDNYSSLDQSKNNARYGSLSLNSYSGTVLAGLNTQGYQHQLYFLLLLQDAADRNYTELAGLSSYKYNHRQASLNYSILKRSQSSINTELGLNLNYDEVTRKDIGPQIAATFGYLQPGISATVYKHFEDRSRFSATLSPAVRLPQNNSVQVPVTDNIFANNIIYPDYNYWASTAGVLGLNLKYITPKWLKDVNSGITFNGVYTTSLSAGKNYNTSTFSPSKNRLGVSLSFNLYF